MPMNMLMIYQEEMEPLRAQERLRAITSIALGFGSISKEASREIQRKLELVANRNKPIRTATPEELAYMGIEIKEVKKDA